MKKVTFGENDKQSFERLFLWFSTSAKEKATGLEKHRQNTRIINKFARAGDLQFHPDGEPKIGEIVYKGGSQVMLLEQNEFDRLKKTLDELEAPNFLSPSIVAVFDILDGAEEVNVSDISASSGQ